MSLRMGPSGAAERAAAMRPYAFCAEGGGGS